MKTVETFAEIEILSLNLMALVGEEEEPKVLCADFFQNLFSNCALFLLVSLFICDS